MDAPREIPELLGAVEFVEFAGDAAVTLLFATDPAEMRRSCEQWPAKRSFGFAGGRESRRRQAWEKRTYGKQDSLSG